MSGFHVAAFAIDGSLVGTGRWERRQLSAKWLAVAEEMVASAVETGRAVVPVKNLEHLELRLTQAEEATLVTYYARGELAVSTILLSGANPAAEAELVGMFTESVRRVAAVAESARQDAFALLPSLSERPLHVVVVWAQSSVSEGDHTLIQELSAHVAGALLPR